MNLSKLSLSFVKPLCLLLLLPVFFLLHGYNENFGFIPFPVIGSLFIYYAGITVLAFALSVLFLKDAGKAFIFSFFCLCLFFFFGFIRDGAKKLLPGGFINSYSFQLPAILIITVLLFIFIRKRMKNTAKASLYITWLLGVFIVVEVITAGYNLVTDKYSKSLFYHPDKQVPETKKDLCARAQPDIFFIVFDEYSSTEGLRTYFDFDNSAMDSLLRASGFYLSTGSRSNYNMTFFSLSSTFNYDYLDIGNNPRIYTNLTLLRAIGTLKKNKLVPYLAGQGYRILNYGCFEIDDTTKPFDTYFSGHEKYILDNQTLISRVNSEIGWKFRPRNPFAGDFGTAKKYFRKKERHLFRNNYNAERLIKELSQPSDKPRFIYAHLMIPHDPFFLDSAGNLIPDSVMLRPDFNREKAYLGQLQYCNQLLKRIIPAASSPAARERVVIIEGDHGYGYHNTPELSDREFRNLNAYYFSDKNYSMLYPSISPVNTFRVVLNKYFCQQYPLLKDSSTYIWKKN